MIQRVEDKIEKEKEAKQKEKELQEEKVKGYKTLNNKLKTFYDHINTPKNKRSYL